MLEGKGKQRNSREKKIIVDCTPDPDESMVEGDILVIAGHDKDIEKLNRKLSE